MVNLKNGIYLLLLRTRDKDLWYHYFSWSDSVLTQADLFLYLFSRAMFVVSEKSIWLFLFRYQVIRAQPQEHMYARYTLFDIVKCIQSLLLLSDSWITILYCSVTFRHDQVMSRVSYSCGYLLPQINTRPFPPQTTSFKIPTSINLGFRCWTGLNLINKNQ